MVLKFCFQNEIHRCSELPENFQALQTFLKSMFQTTLPQDFNLTYMTPDDEIYSLNTEEDYQRLKTLQFSKAIKVFIIEKPIELSLQEVQPKSTEDIQMEEIEGSDSHIEAISLSLDESEKRSDLEIRSEPSSAASQMRENIMEDLMDRIQRRCEDRMSEIPDLKPEQESEIKNIVKETIQEQMTCIVSQVKDTLVKEGFIQQAQPPMQMMPHYPQYFYPNYQPPSQGIQPIYPSYSQAQSQGRVSRANSSYIGSQENSQILNNSHQEIPSQQTEPDFFDKVMNYIIDLPTKAVDFVDNITRKIEGDPVVSCAEGRYPKSVVDKGNYLKEIFKEADRKELMDFVEKFPREMSLNQIAEVWIAQKYSQPQAQSQGEIPNTNTN